LDKFIKKAIMNFNRISIDQGVMLGKPCIKGSGITVELIPDKLAGGADVEANIKLICKENSLL